MRRTGGRDRWVDSYLAAAATARKFLMVSDDWNGSRTGMQESNRLAAEPHILRGYSCLVASGLEATWSPDRRHS
jgi:hypothetical protein